MKKGMHCRPAGLSDDDCEDDWSGPNLSPATKLYNNHLPNAQAQFEALVKEGNLEGVKAVLQKGADNRNRDSAGYTGLMIACNYGQPHLVKYFIEHGSDANEHNLKLIYPLMTVCFSSCKNESNLLECAKILIDKYANLDAVDTHGTTALMFACKAGRCSIVKELIKSKASIEICDTQMWTALFYATNAGNITAVKLLLKAGAKKGVKDIRGRMPFVIAMERQGMQDIAKILCPKRLRFQLNVAEESEFEFQREETEAESLLRKLREIEANFDRPRPTEKGAKLNVYEFLTTNDTELETLGMKYTWQRRTTLMFVKAFHLQPWQRMVQPRLTKYQQLIEDWHNKERGPAQRQRFHQYFQLTYMNAAHIVLGLDKRLQVIKAGAKYLQTSLAANSALADKNLKNHIVLCEGGIEQVSAELQKIIKSLDSHDQEAVNPADLILPNSLAPKGYSKVSVIGLVAVIAFATWKAKLSVFVASLAKTGVKAFGSYW